MVQVFLLGDGRNQYGGRLSVPYSDTADCHKKSAHYSKQHTHLVVGGRLGSGDFHFLVDRVVFFKDRSQV